MRIARFGSWTLLALLASACPAETNDGTRTGGTGGVGGGVPQGGVGGFAGAAGMAGVGGATGGTGGEAGGSAARGSLGATALPCDVTDVLKLRCQSCHGATPVGAPMALMSLEDWTAPGISNPAMSVAQLARARVHDATAPMPPTGMLGADELALLDAWIDGGMQAGTDPSCAPVIDDGPKYEGEIPPFADNCYEVRAHPNGNKAQKLTVSGENYGTFYFDAPWPDNAQGVWFETLDGGHPEILHHWLIYADEKGNSPDGSVNYPGLGTHPTAPTLIAGWAPGADNNDLPSDVGLQLHGSNKKMLMEIHFFGPPGMTYETDAGVKICTVEKAERLRPNVATISWLGTELGINIPPGAIDNPATGICTPNWQVSGAQEIHILRSWPHMHLLGKRMTSTIIRADGTRVPMHSGNGWPFDFNNEISHKTEFVLKPGDRVETTCYYDNPQGHSVGVGFENRYEMCFNFVTAYPAKALINPGFFGSSSLTNSSTACLN